MGDIIFTKRLKSFELSNNKQAHGEFSSIQESSLSESKA